MKTSIIFSSITLFAFLSCNAPKREAYHTVNSKIERLNIDSDTVDFGVSSQDYLQYLKTVHTDSTFTDEAFLIPEREGEITKFRCTNCHNADLDDLKSSNGDPKKSHWNLKLNHAGNHAMKCITCHSPNNMDSLHTITGETISFNHSYKLCSQCHSTQFNDWKDGSHGKRLGGWAPPRVSNTCVNCHNPHDPGFKQKMPAILNTKMMKEHRKSPVKHEKH